MRNDDLERTWVCGRPSLLVRPSNQPATEAASGASGAALCSPPRARPAEHPRRPVRTGARRGFAW